MPQDKKGKKTSVRSSKPLDSSPIIIPVSYDYKGNPSQDSIAMPKSRSMWTGKPIGGGQHIDGRAPMNKNQRKALKSMITEKGVKRAGGRTLKKEKYNRLGGSFTSDM